MTGQTLNTAQMHVKGNESYIVGINLQIQGLLTSLQCAEQVQEFLYDDIGASGNFKTFPNRPELHTEKFILSHIPHPEPMVFDGSLTHNKDTMTTDYKFLVVSSFFEESVANEVSYFQQELDILLGYEQFLSWHQIDLSRTKNSG